VKPLGHTEALWQLRAFSILERIDVGETSGTPTSNWGAWISSFSILERIDVGETGNSGTQQTQRTRLSVSSNGSTWVKLDLFVCGDTHCNSTFSILERIDVGETMLTPDKQVLVGKDFQYPRTDRRG